MKFPFRILLGAAVGYVFGTRAGRERYDEIVSKVHELRQSDKVRQFESDAHETADRVGHRLNQRATTVADKAKDRIGRHDAGSGGTGQASAWADTPASPVAVDPEAVELAKELEEADAVIVQEEIIVATDEPPPLHGEGDVRDPERPPM